MSTFKVDTFTVCRPFKKIKLPVFSFKMKMVYTNSKCQQNFNSIVVNK